MRTGFEPDHVPLVKLPRTVKKGLMLTSVWSFKTNASPVDLLGTLTADAWVHFETNPQIERISSYPVEMPYHKVDHNGFGSPRSHIPQLGLLYRPRRGENQGRIVYLDVVGHEFRKKTNLDEERVSKLRAEFKDRLNAGYGVIDERTIWVEPRLTNMRTIHRHLHGHVEPEKELVRSVLKHMGTASINEVRAAAGLTAAPYYEITDARGAVVYRRQLDDEDKAWTALMQMAASGEVSFDMSRPITDHCLVSFNFERNGYR